MSSAVPFRCTFAEYEALRRRAKAEKTSPYDATVPPPALSSGGTERVGAQNSHAAFDENIMKKLLCAVLTATAALLAATHPDGMARAGEEGALRIGVCLAVSGDFWEHGRIELAGINIRVKELNAMGGLDGRAVELVVKDNASTPQGAADAIEELAGDGVQIVIGPALSGFIPAMREMAQKHDMIIISPTATLPGLGKRGERVFSIMYGDDFQGAALAAFIGKRLAIRDAAVIMNSESAYSRSIAAAFINAYSRLGGRIVATEIYNVPAARAYDHDFGDILGRVKAANPGIVLLPNYHDEVASIISQATRMDFQTRFCGGDSWDNTAIFVASGKSIDGAYFIAIFDPDTVNPQMDRFLQLLDESHDTEAAISSVTGYDAVSIAVEAARGASTTDQMIANLHALRDFPLATGTITIDPDRGTLKTVYICQIVDTGGNTYARRIVAHVDPGSDDDSPDLLEVKED